MLKHANKIQACHLINNKTMKRSQSAKKSHQSLDLGLQQNEKNLGKPLIKPKPSIPIKSIGRTMSVPNKSRPPVLSRSFNLIKENITVDDGKKFTVNCLQKKNKLFVYLTGLSGQNCTNYIN